MAIEKKIHALVVDDSALVRKVLTELLLTHPAIASVETAQDPIFARAKMREKWPDFLVLDIEMPRMDGLTFLRTLMAEKPLPILICSSLTRTGSKTAVEALSAGAIDIIAKPELDVQKFLVDSTNRIHRCVNAALDAALEANQPQDRPGVSRPSRDFTGPPRRDRIIAFGASAGGTRALESIFSVLPPNLPGMVVVQHMPGGFTRAFAERLAGLASLEIREARGGETVTPGTVLIAPGDRHMQLVQKGEGYTVRVSDGPRIGYHRPSVNVLFRSVARVAGQGALGILLTGMGDDGAAGLLEMRQAGALTIAQDRASCVVFGMPAAAIERGAAVEVLGLNQIPDRILSYCREEIRKNHA